MESMGMVTHQSTNWARCRAAMQACTCVTHMLWD